MKICNIKNTLIKHSCSISNFIGTALNTGASATIAMQVQGPLGIMAGATLGAGIQQACLQIGDEISKQQLSNSESVRVGEVYIEACNEISKKIQQGKQVRND